MVQSAAELKRPGFAELRKLLAPFPGRAATASRVALICALTTLVTMAYGTPEAALSAYIVFFLIRADRVTSAVLSSVMLLLITVVIGIVLGVALVVLDDPAWRVGAIAVLSALLLFVTSASKLRPIGAIVAMIIGFTLDKLGSVPFGEAATRALLYAWLMVAIPVAVAIAVNLACAPSPRRLLGRELAQRLRLAARALREPEATRDALDACVRHGDAQLGSWLKLSVLEGSTVRADAPALKEMLSTTFAILTAASLVSREPAARLPDAYVAPLAGALEAMAAMLDAGGYPVEIALALPAGDELSPLARLAVDQLRDAITGFAVPSRETPPPAEKKAGGFFLPDAFSNPDHIRYALKTTVAAMICYLLYSQLDWSGIHTCFITVYVVSLGTTAETVEKLTLRIAGCLVGAALGTAALVFVMPGLSSISQLLAVVLIGSWLSAWVAFGSPRIAYAGFQIAFAFFLCVIQGAAPAFDLTIARDRTIGILLGNVVVYLIFTRVWPVSVSARVDATLAALRGQWAKLTALTHPGTRRAQAAAALATGETLRQDLALMHYEPSWVRPSSDWIGARRAAFAKLDALEGPMFLLAERAPGDPAIDGWLRRLADDEARAGQDAGPSTPQAKASGAADPHNTPDTPLAAVAPALDGDASRDPHAALSAPASSDPASDPLRAALRALGDARLIQLERAAADDAAKEHTIHAPA
jgi:multidrug resistance protein MdtO